MSRSNIIMYTTEDGITKIEVTFDQNLPILLLTVKPIKWISNYEMN